MSVTEHDANSDLRERLSKHPASIYYLMLGSTLFLLTLGLAMVWSASAIDSLRETGGSTDLFFKQGLFAVLGGCVLICIQGLRNRGKDWVYPSVGIAASVLAGIHAWFDFSLQMPAVAMTFAAILGVACAQSYSSRPPP